MRDTFSSASIFNDAQTLGLTPPAPASKHPSSVLRALITHVLTALDNPHASGLIGENEKGSRTLIITLLLDVLMSDLVADMEERLKAYHHAMSAMFDLIDTWIAEEAQGGDRAAREA